MPLDKDNSSSSQFKCAYCEWFDWRWSLIKGLFWHSPKFCNLKRFWFHWNTLADICTLMLGLGISMTQMSQIYKEFSASNSTLRRDIDQSEKLKLKLVT